MSIEGTSDGENNDVKTSEHTEEENFRPHTGEGASPGKIFIGGLPKDTTLAEFNKHFGAYGEMSDSVIMKDRRSGQPRGFGFVTYKDPSVVDKVIEDDHVFNGKQVEIKRTIPKGSAGSKDIKIKTKKIFVGGIPTTVTEDEFKDFFSKYGEVSEHMIMRDHATSRSRGFGFITFDTEESVDNLLSKGNRIELAGAQVEIKKAEPKKGNPPPPPAKRFNDSRPAYGGAFGDSYGGYGGGGAAAAAAAVGGSYGPSPYRSGGGRPGAYGGYGGSEFGGGYGGYGGSSLGGYDRGEPPSLGYSSRYGGSYGRGYDIGSAYGGAGEGYGGYGGGAVGGFGSSSYDTGLGLGGYGGGTGSSFYGSRGGYGGGGAPSGRYHPYGR